MLLLQTIACSDPVTTVIDLERKAAPVGDTAAEQIGTPETSPPDVEEVDPQDTADLDADVFRDDVIHQIEIQLDGESWSALESDPYSWAPGTVTYDGAELPHVGVRLRGKIGSFRTLDGKPKLKLSFDEYVDDQRLHGLKELSLNNAVVDCSYLKEPMAWKVFEGLGVPHLRTAFAHLIVNGSDYGLYQVLETPDDVWLERHWDDASGNLYDGKYVWYGGYSYTLLDFGIGVDDLFQLEEGEDVANADIAAVSAVVTQTRGTAEFYTAMDQVLDWDLFHRMVVGETFVGHLDGYSMNTNNYRVYFDPADGKAHILPWDMDYTFLEDWQWGMSWAYPRAQITSLCYGDAACAAVQRTHASAFLDNVDTEGLLSEYDRLAALTWEATQNDPRRECSAADVASWRVTVRDWIANRVTVMRGWGM